MPEINIASSRLLFSDLKTGVIWNRSDWMTQSVAQWYTMIGPVSDKKSVANNYPNMVNLIYLSCRHWWFGTIRSRQVLNLQRPRILFVLSGTPFHNPDCVLITQSWDSSPVVLERLHKFSLQMSKQASSKFESILTSCLRTHLKTHWEEQLQCNNLFLQFS